MPTVTVQWYTGRDAAKKRRVAEGIMRVLMEEGVAPAATSIIFQDIAKEDWLSGPALVEPPKG
jgi:phenylpyruvate tautomerase PptA (4-oxalocrotonate tautomerase family)